MTPLVVVRGIAGAAMPLVLLVGALKKRRARPLDDSSPWPDESGPDLPRLEGRRLRDFSTGGGDLRTVDLRGSDLHGLRLRKQNLTGVNLTRASLRGSDLAGAVLAGAQLRGTDLSKADLSGADLDGADLFETVLWKADLRGADLSRSRNLVMASLHHARFDSTTRFPRGFDPRSAGADPVDDPHRGR